MKDIGMTKTQRSSFASNTLAAGLLLLLAQFPAELAFANAGFGPNTDISGRQIAVPTFYANSPQGVQVALGADHLPVLDAAGNPVTVASVLAMINPRTQAAYTVTQALAAGLLVDTGTAMRKFVKPLPGVYNGLEGDGIPVGLPEKWKNPITGAPSNDDYYEIGVVEYELQMHPDLPKKTRLRGYVQIETETILTGGLKDITGVVGSEHIPATYLDGSPILKWTQNAAGKWEQSNEQVYFVHAPNYLGPSIVVARGTAVRIKATNYLPYTDAQGFSHGSPTHMGGELPLPVDELIAGGGPVLDANGNPLLSLIHI